MYCENMEDIRLEKDLNSLTMVKKILVKLAIDLLEKTDVLNFLKTPHNLDAIANKCKLKNKKMLENILDVLVTEKILNYENGYYLPKKIKTIEVSNEEKFLKENYKESLEWVNFVNEYSENTLITGKPSKLTGFEEEKAIYYWNKIMEQSPYSLRTFAIKKAYEDLKPGSLILDYGCGSGVGLEQLIKLADVPVRFIGTDPSKKFFVEAKNRLKKLNFKKGNKKNTKLIEFKKLNYYKGKCDVVFTSLIFNHVPPEEYVKVFKKINSMLKPHGKFIIVQFLDFEKYNRNPIWIMHNIPTHVGYPMKNRFIRDLKSVFPQVNEYLDGIILVSTK